MGRIEIITSPQRPSRHWSVIRLESPSWGWPAGAVLAQQSLRRATIRYAMSRIASFFPSSCNNNVTVHENAKLRDKGQSHSPASAGVKLIFLPKYSPPETSHRSSLGACSDTHLSTDLITSASGFGVTVTSAHDTSWDARHNRICRDIPGHHGTRTNRRTFTDGYP
jgi:hypothetical protein